jgi:hypothetical protein
MKFFADMATKPSQEGTVINGTPAYIELATHSPNADPPGSSYLYVVPTDEHSYIVSACWERQFDQLSELIADPKLGKLWLKVLLETFPVFGSLVVSGIEGYYSDAAIVNMADPDDGESKWFTATVVGNMSVQSAEDLEQRRFIEAYELILGKSFTVAGELATNEISTASKLKLMAAGAWHGYVEGLEIQTKWMARLAGFGQY